MRKLGEAFYGRVKSYVAAFGVLPDRTDLEALLGRTVYAEAPSQSPRLADYVLAQRDALSAMELERLSSARARTTGVSCPRIFVPTAASAI